LNNSHTSPLIGTSISSRMTLFGQLSFFVENPIHLSMQGTVKDTKADYVMSCISQSPGISAEDLMAATNMKRSTLARYYKGLKEEGYRIVRVIPRGLKFFPPTLSNEDNNHE
jgi:hypothetical protein